MASATGSYYQNWSKNLGIFDDLSTVIGGVKNALSKKALAKKEKEEALLKEFQDHLDWFPLTPHFHKHKIKSKKIDNKAVFWKIKNKRLNKAFLDFLLKFSLSKMVFPTMRRVYPSMVVDSLVSVQPMSLPSGLLFYLDYSYGSGSQSALSGSSVYGTKTNP